MMRRTRASAPTLAAIGLLLALLASLLAAGPASAAGGPVLDVTRGPANASGAVAPGAVAEYELRGRPGGQVSMELIDLNAGACHSFFPLDLSLSTAGGAPVGLADMRDCASYGPWTFPADGVLVVQLRTSVIDQSFQLRFGPVDFEDVPVRLRSGSARLTGAFSVALDGTDYVVRADPGQQLVIQTANTFCDFFTPQVKVLGSDERELRLPEAGSCSTVGTWQIPPGGVVKVRVGHVGPLTGFPTQARYDFTVNVFRYPTVKLPPRRETVEVRDTVTVPMGGTDYAVTDSADVDSLAVEVLGLTSNDGCAEDATSVELNVELIVDGIPTGRQPLSCGRSIATAKVWNRSLVVRITGFSRSGDRPSTGKYRVAIHPLHTTRTPVNVTAGPSTVSGSIDVGGDVNEYVITGPPGRILVAHDPDRSLPSGTCLFPGESLTVSSNDATFDPSLRRPSTVCGWFGPFRIPASGVIHVQVSSQREPFPVAGSYRLTFDTFDYETVPVDITGGPQEVSGHLEIPLDGTNYLVTGLPGDQVRFEVLSLEAPASCDTTQVFPLEVDVYNPENWFDLSVHDVGFNGCGLYQPNATIGADGKLVFRAFLGGTGNQTSGGYTIRFSKVV